MSVNISAALKAHLAQPYQTTATLWLVTLTNGTALGFTDHDQDIVFNSFRYVALEGYTRTDIAGDASLNVDNVEVQGILSSPSITEQSLAAGLWDYAQVTIGTVNYNDLTMGVYIQRSGWLGEVTVERGVFKAELRGLAQAYTRVIGQLTGPGCRTTLGSSKCKINVATFTKTGALTGVGLDNRTLYDTSRTEPGPTGGIPILGITNANPGVVTLASPLGLPSGSAVAISTVTGMALINTNVVAYDVAGNSFDVGVDTTNYGTYTGGGIVTPLGSNSGYFDNGIITFLTGLNSLAGGAGSNLSMEVLSYVPGQWVLQLPMPYQCAIGDTYSMVAGCDYSFNTCRTRFANVINFRGEPYVPGVDKLMQVGKQS